MIISVAATVEDLIADGRAALRNGDVAAARGLFQTALTLGPNSATLEGLGFAAYLAMEFDEAIDLWQQSYAGYRADGNGVGAVRMARMLGYPYGIVVGDWAIGPGWIARAQHLLGVAADSSERGWVDPARDVAAAAAGNAAIARCHSGQPAGHGRLHQRQCRDALARGLLFS